MHLEEGKKIAELFSDGNKNNDSGSLINKLCKKININALH